MKNLSVLAATLTMLTSAVSPTFAQTAASPAPAPWTPDRGDGTYQNPLAVLDLPDPDVIRVGEDYFFVCSTFSNTPGLTILQSKDLVNWSWVAHALPRLVPDAHFTTPRRGDGVWAPSIRHHGGRFYIFWGDPDFGVYQVNAAAITGPWTAPTLVKAGKGLIDSCPFWDNDGSVWLVHGWAKSRAGVNNKLTLHRLNADATAVTDAGLDIIDVNALPGKHTLEGPKVYRRGDFYYIFAPDGGVAHGWQSVFRARKLQGPWEERTVLARGTTPVNGPHQGGWVTTPAGDEWFIHFQDRGPWGRIPHLQPVVWKNDWPVMGNDPDGDGTGEPVLVHAKPKAPAQPIATLTLADDFNAPTLGLQWQWEANPDVAAWSLTAKPGTLQLTSTPAASLWVSPNVLTQRLAGPASVVTTTLNFAPTTNGERAGLVVMGLNYAWIELRNTAEGALELVQGECLKARDGGKETVLARKAFQPAPTATDKIAKATTVQFRAEIGPDAKVQFAFSADGKIFEPLGKPFQAVEGRWVGARIGVYSLAPAATAASTDAAKPGAGMTWIDSFDVRVPAGKTPAQADALATVPGQ